MNFDELADVKMSASTKATPLSPIAAEQSAGSGESSKLDFFHDFLHLSTREKLRLAQVLRNGTNFFGGEFIGDFVHPLVKYIQVVGCVFTRSIAKHDFAAIEIITICDNSRFIIVA